jgi:UDPglucose 6-dehydrogenase
MSVESAEMTKHALNAFLATSVSFINEVATVCESVGADAKEVERGLKSDPRIGSRAYLSAGAAFAGGTLARDVAFLSSLAPLELIPAVKRSNDAHLLWTRRKIEELWSTLQNVTVAIWGLTYKPGTDTLRRSAAIELILWLNEIGARAVAFDPVVNVLPEAVEADVRLADSPEDAMTSADVLVIATEWPQFRDAARTLAAKPDLVVLDPNGFLRDELSEKVTRYLMVGRGRT